MNKPLTDKELDRLADFLADIGPAAMNLEMLDGFFVALISGPDMVMPGEYLPQIWGEDFSFDADEQAIEILDLLMRHWNHVAAQLLHGMNDPQHIYMPLLLQDEAGIARGNDWAKGYMRGAQMRPGSWHELSGSEDRGGDDHHHAARP